MRAHQSGGIRRRPTATSRRQSPSIWTVTKKWKLRLSTVDGLDEVQGTQDFILPSCLPRIMAKGEWHHRRPEHVPVRRIGGVSFWDASGLSTDGMVWFFDWDLYLGKYDLKKAVLEALHQEYVKYVETRLNGAHPRKSFSFSIAASGFDLPVLKEDREDWEKKLKALLSDNANLWNLKEHWSWDNV